MDLSRQDKNEPLEPSATFQEAVKRSDELSKLVVANPENYRVLTGDRPTGSLHLGHLFGSLLNRVNLQNLGVTSFIVIADYQVFTDRETSDNLADNVKNLVLDYMSVGLNPDSGRTHIFAHSQIPELNQLLLPFLTLVTMQELDRNPTVKEEIRAAGLRTIQAIMYCYPVHQAADILFCHANLIPVGKDQLPHLELTRKIARRFNERFGRGKEILKFPEALLSEAPSVLGLDGTQKMSKSRGNAVFLSDDEDVTRRKIMKAKTDSLREVTFDPKNRPEIANLLQLISLSTGESVEKVVSSLEGHGAAKLKEVVAESLNQYLLPIRQRRAQLSEAPEIVRECLERGVAVAREEARSTLKKVNEAIGMNYLGTEL
jgi:tryptophanyl-tRNA synthetase